MTVTEFDKDSFKVGLAPETLDRTNLGESEGGAWEERWDADKLDRLSFFLSFVLCWVGIG